MSKRTIPKIKRKEHHTLTVHGKDALNKLKRSLDKEGTKYAVRRHGSFYKVYPK